MKNYREQPYSQRIRHRILALRFAAVFMLIYMVVISELGGGDSRIMTPLADFVSDMLLFGGLVYILIRIHRNKRLLSDKLLLKEKMLQEKDERNCYLHDKSGGIVMDVVMLVVMFITCTTALFDMAAFYASFAVLICAVTTKATVWSYYNKYSR